MSLVTHMVLCVGSGRDRGLEALQAWCVEHDPERGQTFGRLDPGGAGGVKVFTGEVYAMAGNYFPYRDLAEAFPHFPWDYPAVLVVSPEGESVQVVLFDAELRKAGDPWHPSTVPCREA